MQILRFSSLQNRLFMPDRIGRISAIQYNTKQYITADLATVLPVLPKFTSIRLVVFVHGFRYTPADSATAAPQHTKNPHKRIYRDAQLIPLTLAQQTNSVSWPLMLNTSYHDKTELALAFGWDSNPGWFGFNYIEAYKRTQQAAAHLTAILSDIKALYPNTQIYCFSHSLGSAVLLRLFQIWSRRYETVSSFTRVIFTGAAELQDMVSQLPVAMPDTHFYNFTCRTDHILDTFAEHMGPRSGEVLGHNGLPGSPSNWMDLQIDDDNLRQWGIVNGYTIGGDSHEAYLTQLGNWKFYSDIFYNAPQTDMELLRSLGIPEMQEPPGD
jgi:hypothetical protein